jgi:MOSC domain-containing protein YiiM
VQITQPREPCFKFAHKFGTEAVLHQFIEYGYPGTYVRVLDEGDVKTGDTFTLIEEAAHSVSIFHFFQLLYAEDKNKDHIKTILNNDALPEKLKKRLKFFIR